MPNTIIRRSALSEIYQTGDFGHITTGPPGLIFRERHTLSIIQIAAWPDQVDTVVDLTKQTIAVEPLKTACSVSRSDDTTAIWVGPNRWLIVEPEHRDLESIIRHAIHIDLAAVTDQSQSRCVIRLSGVEARNVLRKGTTLDLDALYFKADEAKTTSLFHMNALIHYLGQDTFDVYVARSFGQSFFEVICHAAAEYGYRVDKPLAGTTGGEH